AALAGADQHDEHYADVEAANESDPANDDASTLHDADYDDGDYHDEGDHYDDLGYDDHEIVPLTTDEEGEVVALMSSDDYEDGFHDDELQIVVEMDGEPVHYDADDELDAPPEEDLPEPLPAVEPEIVTNKAFKRALKDLRKSNRR
ncbi:MAG: hypothetical protein AAF499_10390, partial [Pseudomonadota bacterium]